MNTEICSHHFNPLHLFEAFAGQLVYLYVSSILFFLIGTILNWYKSFPKRRVPLGLNSIAKIDLKAHCFLQF